MAVLIPVPGVDWRVLNVDGTGAVISAANPLPVATTAGSGGGTVSTANSTTTPLIGNATFTGTGEDVSSYAAIVVSVFADHSAAVGSPQIQYSSDNTNWDLVENYEFNVLATSFISAPKAKFARVVYVNGAVAQTFFRLQTVYHAAPVPAPDFVYSTGSANYPSVRSASSLTNGFAGATQPALVTALQNAAGTFDFAHNTQDVVVQAAAATGTGTINTDIVNYNAQVFVAHANVTSYGAAGSFLMKVQVQDANGLFVDIPGATTGALVTGTDLLLVVGARPWPSDTATAFYANFPLPRRLRLVEVIGVNSVTFSAAYFAGGM